MANLTTSEALGSGLDFETLFDVKTEAGSVATTSGLDKLGVDIAFALHREVRDSDTQIRGQPFTPELREDFRVLTGRVLASMSRVASFDIDSVTEPDDAPRTAEVAVTVVAQTGERGEFVFEV